MAAIHLNKELFHQYINNEDKPILVEFWAPWCVYCKRITPAMKKIADQYENELFVGLLNIDEEEKLSDDEKIELIPTLVIYKGGKALGSIVAPDSKAKIEAFIKETLAQ